MALEQLAAWISFERKCCPFFAFKIDAALLDLHTLA